MHTLFGIILKAWFLLRSSPIAWKSSINPMLAERIVVFVIFFVFINFTGAEAGGKFNMLQQSKKVIFGLCRLLQTKHTLGNLE